MASTNDTELPILFTEIIETVNVISDSVDFLANLLGQLHSYGVFAFFEFTTGNDIFQPEKSLAYIVQGLY